MEYSVSSNISPVYASGFNFIPITSLSSGDIKKCFEILCSNLKSQGYKIPENDFKIWRNNIKLNFESSRWFLVYNNGSLSGFITMSITNGQLFCSEIQFSESIKGTRAIIKVLKFLNNFKQFDNFDEVYFNINNNNIKSLKTFAHLSPEKVSSNSNSTLFKLSRANLKKYLNSFNDK